MRLGDLDALKEDLKQYFSDGTLDSVSAKLAFNMILRKIDNAPTVEQPQGDLISREALKKAFDDYIKANPNISGIFEVGKFIIDNAPTVEQEVYMTAKDYNLYLEGYKQGKKDFERPQGNIRWTDKLSVKSNGDIIDFEGRVVGHINLEEIKGGAE